MQRVQGDMDMGDLVISKTGLKEVHKEMLIRQHYGNFSGESAWLAASPRCLYTNICITGSKQEESEVYIEMQGYDPFESTETCWDEEPCESLPVRISGQTKASNTHMKICSRSCDQEKEEDEAFLRQPEVTSHLQALVFMKNLNHHDIHWKGNMTECN